MRQLIPKKLYYFHAVVFHSRKTYRKYVDISKLLPFMQSGQIDLRFAKDNVIIGH